MTSDTAFSAKGWTPDQIGSLKGKSYVITGANTGAGFQAARILLSKSAKVLMLNRSAEKSDIAIADLKQEFGEGADVSFIQMDLSVQACVHKAAEQVLETLPHIDALICNAAIAQVAKQEITVDGFESHLAVNYFGHFILCNRLFERLNKSAGRIVMVGSEGYKMGIKTIQFDDINWDTNYHANNTYCHSKLAQMMFAYELQRRIKKAGKAVKVYVCHPGASKTSLINHKASFFSRLMFSLMAMSPMVQSAEKGCYPELMCATEDKIKQLAYYGPTGPLNWVGPVGECKLENFALDHEIAARLWTLTEEKTGINWQLRAADATAHFATA
ncbi:SDR family oxidoreductase [Agaribacterium haliotis]|uniref:SDR family oxidoreductase n=1 Tax=Agaribacterium haliotis TaxID=2013869 RepID=UPI000BB5605C|nr:SDR family oxidoreductase [Agaribacterium haliotis]